MPIHLIDVVAPVVVAILFIVATSAFKEPQRRHFNAIMIAGAGAAYLNGGLGIWEFAFTAVVTYCAYRGLNAYGFIGLGWILHTGWDVMHHLYGNPIVPFVPTSSLGCAICDPVIAAWCFAGAPSVYGPSHQEKAHDTRSRLASSNILQLKPVTSVDTICGHYSGILSNAGSRSGNDHQRRAHGTHLPRLRRNDLTIPRL